MRSGSARTVRKMAVERGRMAITTRAIVGATCVMPRAVKVGRMTSPCQSRNRPGARHCTPLGQGRAQGRQDQARTKGPSQRGRACRDSRPAPQRQALRGRGSETATPLRQGYNRAERSFSKGLCHTNNGKLPMQRGQVGLVHSLSRNHFPSGVWRSGNKASPPITSKPSHCLPFALWC